MKIELTSDELAAIERAINDRLEEWYKKFTILLTENDLSTIKKAYDTVREKEKETQLSHNAKPVFLTKDQVAFWTMHHVKAFSDTADWDIPKIKIFDLL